MITDLTTSMLYICPECSTTSLRTISAFEVKKDGLSLRCSNKKCCFDNILMSHSKDKYKINIDCPICGDEHIFTLSVKTVFNKDFLILNCPQSGFGILFMGKDTKRLREECSAQAETIAGIIAENDETYDELDILFEIIELINQYANNQTIHCNCNNEDITIGINTNSVTLTCKNCKKSVTLDANSETLSLIAESGGVTIE